MTSVLNNPRRSTAGSLMLLTLTGCIPTPPQGVARAPDTTVPESFDESRDTTTSASVDWRELFADEHLVSLIDRALEHNQELNILVQETLVANAEIIARRGEYLPQVSFGAGAGIEHVGETTSQGRSDETNGVPANLQDYSFGFYASWEIDVWRRLRNARDAAIYRYLSSVEGRNFMVTRVVAEIASSYYELIALDQQLEVVQSNIELLEGSLEIVRLQLTAGRATALAVARFEAELREFQSRQFEIQQEIVETENRINFLVARFPQRVERRSGDFLEIEPPLMSAGIPAQLLQNRPDVRRAELELQAFEMDVRAARARFYPTLSIEAGVGYQAYDVRRLLDTPGSLLYNLFANLMAPLLNRNAIKAGYFAANSRQMQAVFNYERSILGAHIEVVNRLNLIENLKRSFELKEQRVERLEASIEISMILFNNARADYLEVLTTRRDALDAEMDLIEARQRQLVAAVMLYQALGGGWHQDELPVTEETPSRGGEDE